MRRVYPILLKGIGFRLFQRSFIRVAAAVPLGIAVPPLIPYAPGCQGIGARVVEVQEGPKYSPSNTLSLVYIIKKDRISTCFPR